MISAFYASLSLLLPGVDMTDGEQWVSCNHRMALSTGAVGLVCQKRDEPKVSITPWHFYASFGVHYIRGIYPIYTYVYFIYVCVYISHNQFVYFICTYESESVSHSVMSDSL